ncbi:MAG: hypothetical protein HRT53_07265 [Colwellia sp.]|nr:hypothetical protein [Colwellia sp.]
MKIKTILLCTVIASSTAFTAIAATHQGVSVPTVWAESYRDANNGAFNNLKASYPSVHEIRVQCLNMRGAWKCHASGVIDI